MAALTRSAALQEEPRFQEGREGTPIARKMRAIGRQHLRAAGIGSRRVRRSSKRPDRAAGAEAVRDREGDCQRGVPSTIQRCSRRGRWRARSCARARHRAALFPS